MDTNRIRKQIARACAFCLPALLFLFGTLCRGQQTTGDILGTVTDASGAIIDGATVTVENLGTHERRSQSSTASGDYVFNLLNPGSYSISVTRNGFKKYTVPSLALAAGDRMRINVQLVVGGASETVEVQAEASALRTDSSVLSSTIDSKSTQDLPLNGRNFIQLIQLAPGANEGPPSALAGGTQLDERRQSASISINGQSDVLNNEMIDGVDNNERLIGTIAVRPPIDAISEMSVQSNTYTAEVGRTGGGIINLITKSGTDQYHGTAYEFFRNDIFNTSNYNFGGNLPKAEWRQNQYGGSLGGPVKKDKLFFFGAYEGFRLVQGIAPTVSIVPTAAEEAQARAGNDIDFSDVGGPLIPRASIDPVALYYFKMYPAPTGTNSNGQPVFIGGFNQVQYSTVADARFDYSINSNNALYGRWAYNSVFTRGPGSFPAVTLAGIKLQPNGGSWGQDNDYDAMLNFTHIFNPRLLLELKAGYTRSDNQSFPVTQGQFPNEAFGQPNVNTHINNDGSGLATVRVTKGAQIGSVVFSPVQDQDNTWEYMGTLTWTHGKHNVKFGGAIIRRQLTSVQSSFAEGLWSFTDYPSLVQGHFTTNGGRSLELDAPHLRMWEPAGYVQDDWRATQSLTLNLGVRYSLFTPYTEVQNRISTFDPATGNLLIAGQNGVSSTAGIQTDHHGWSPRIGFAYTLGHGAVIRGGYGIGFFQMNYTAYANLKNIPFVATSAPCSYVNCGPGFTRFADGLPAPTAGRIDQAGAAISAGTDPHFRTSYIEQFNLTFQQAFGANVVTGSYVGLLGRQLRELLSDLNAPPPNTCGTNATCYNALRPYHAVDPFLNTVAMIRPGGYSSYNAFQFSVERRFSRGVSANINYQLAHSLDNIVGISEQNSNGGYGTVPSRVNQIDYGNSDLNIRSRVAGTISYALPFGHGATGMKSMAISNWELNLIGADSTGIPYSVTNAVDLTNTHPGASNADRPNVIDKPTVSSPGPALAFNTAAFKAQAVGTVGNEHRNMLSGTHFRHLDLSLFKVFPVGERLKAEFRAEGFNVTNTANFGVPNFQLNGANFGKITSMSPNYQPRVLQFALKLSF